MNSSKHLPIHFGCAMILATASAQAAPIALYDFEAGGGGNTFGTQAGLNSVDADPNTIASILTTGGPQGLDGGGAGNIFNNAQPGSASGPPLSNWGNGNNTEATANFAQFTITPEPLISVTYESLSLYHGAFNDTPKFKFTYQIGAGPEVTALGPTGHTAQNTDPLTFLSEDFADFTTEEVVTWRIYVFDANDFNTGSRFDDITINATTTIVPSPTAAIAGLVGLAGLGMRRRRK